LTKSWLHTAQYAIIIAAVINVVAPSYYLELVVAVVLV